MAQSKFGELFRKYPGELFTAAVLFFVNVIGDGSYLWSFCVCFIWFLIAIAGCIPKSGRKNALFRIACPVVVFAIAYGNCAIQCKIAESNAEQVFTACENFNRDNGRYPETLSELCPQYMPYVPRAKYCLWSGQFVYYTHKDRPVPGYTLKYYIIPPMARMVHNSGSPGWFLVD
jgi:hypothetical protein